MVVVGRDGDMDVVLVWEFGDLKSSENNVSVIGITYSTVTWMFLDINQH